MIPSNTTCPCGLAAAREDPTGLVPVVNLIIVPQRHRTPFPPAAPRRGRGRRGRGGREGRRGGAHRTMIIRSIGTSPMGACIPKTPRGLAAAPTRPPGALSPVVNLIIVPPAHRRRQTRREPRQGCTESFCWPAEYPGDCNAVLRAAERQAPCATPHPEIPTCEQMLPWFEQMFL